jgi:hypothetical protein
VAANDQIARALSSPELGLTAIVGELKGIRRVAGRADEIDPSSFDVNNGRD